jgi:hypothetical protein
MFRIAADHRGANARMLPRENTKQAGEHILSDGRRGAKGQLAGVISAQRGNLMFSPDQERVRLLGVTQEKLAGLGQRNVRSSTIEELDANILLKRLDLEADCGLRQIQLFSGLAEAALFGNSPEDNQAKIIETRHRTIRTPQHGAMEDPAASFKAQMAGIDPKMIRSVMNAHGDKSLEQLMKETGRF